VVCADGQFGLEVAADLRDAGLDVTIADPRDGDPDVEGAVGLVAGTELDTTNLALAEHARHNNSGLFLAVRQKTYTNAALLEAMDIDSIFVPTQLVARESLARVVTPVYWSFVDHVLGQDEEWSKDLLRRIVRLCGPRTPEGQLVTLDQHQAPSVLRWLRSHELTLGDFIRHPDDRDQPLPLVPLLLIRDGETTFTPSSDHLLAAHDQILFLGRRRGFGGLRDALFHDAGLEYVATGRHVPSTWLWRMLARRRTPPATD
jgi:hypothetical protein